MANVFEIEIITPEKTVYSGKASSVTCPGVQGRFQILSRHAAFLSTLEAGPLDLIDESGTRQRYAISGGLTQVFENRVRVLADTAELAVDIDIARAEEARKRAEQRLKDRDEKLDHQRARASLLRAMNRIKVARLS